MAQGRGQSYSTSGVPRNPDATAGNGDKGWWDSRMKQWGFRQPDWIANPDQTRMNEIDAAIAESENSPYNEAKISQEQQDVYKNLMLGFKQGLSPEERAEATNDYSMQRNMGAQNAMNVGGGSLSKYINANLNAKDNQFATSLNSKDQERKMQYLGMLQESSKDFGRVNELNFNKQMMIDQALGTAKQSLYDQENANKVAAYQTQVASWQGLGNNLFSGGTAAAKMMG